MHDFMENMDKHAWHKQIMDDMDRKMTQAAKSKNSAASNSGSWDDAIPKPLTELQKIMRKLHVNHDPESGRDTYLEELVAETRHTGNARLHGGVKFEFRAKRYCRYKFIDILKAMPDGKRKYILMHKRAYDLYMQLIKEAALANNDDNIDQRLDLQELIYQLRAKINS